MSDNGQQIKVGLSISAAQDSDERPTVLVQMTSDEPGQPAHVQVQATGFTESEQGAMGVVEMLTDVASALVAKIAETAPHIVQEVQPERGVPQENVQLDRDMATRELGLAMYGVTWLSDDRPAHAEHTVQLMVDTTMKLVNQANHPAGRAPLRAVPRPISHEITEEDIAAQRQRHGIAGFETPQSVVDARAARKAARKGVRFDPKPKGRA